ncbi:MAG: hypothetical protein IPJ61_19585 [Tessaracoccus sp.]|uniref:hypothetical protein n=1 Tax=Tessaracoccus sp. TaxID=1971211 RepID=UPI001ED7BF67|nr:hypothetical protein [Tessaracoccus sp.]MBK7823190.1 hypothetical protein [Tessaracoccus sp.]
MASITLLGRSRKPRKSRKSASKGSCTTSKGRLRKGWRYAKGGRCVRAKGKR